MERCLVDRSELYNDAEEAQRLVLDGRQSTIWTAIPGIVQSVNFAQMTCEVQPAIQGTIQDESGKIRSVNLPLLVDVPMVFTSAGGFTITLPVAVGNECLVLFSSRCIDAWWQSGGIQRPMEARMHDLSDGFAFFGPKSIPNIIPSINTTGLQIRNNAGTTYVEISSDGKIKLVTPSSVDITGNLNVSGAISSDGNISSGGDIDSDGTITAVTDVIGSGISLHTHTHPQSGGGNTGAPNP